MKLNILGVEYIEGEEVFQIAADNFSVAPSSSGYTLNWSTDGENFDAWSEETPADENLRVLNSQPGGFFKLVGNTDTVMVRVQPTI